MIRASTRQTNIGAVALFNTRSSSAAPLVGNSTAVLSLIVNLIV